MNDLYNYVNHKLLNPKILLTADFTPYTSYNGIKQINVFDWLLDK